MKMQVGDTKRSWALIEEARKYFPRGGTLTNSKVPIKELRNVEPVYFVRGNGSRVWDYDGNEYIDFRCALGPITLGYNYPDVTKSVQRVVIEGNLFGGSHPDELTLAKKLVEIIPCAEMVGFMKTGCEAMAAAWTAARAFSGKDKILQVEYNGWFLINHQAPEVLGWVTGCAGIPSATSSLVEMFRHGDISWLENKLKQEADKIAGVCIAAEYTKLHPEDKFLLQVRELTKEYGVLMIMDEIVTGFRVAIGGVHEYFGFKPDLAGFAKGIANGFPISVYCGRRDVMSVLSEKAFVTSTYAGDRIGIAAALATINVYQTKNVIAHFWRLGNIARDGIEKVLHDERIQARVTSLPPCLKIQFEYDDAETNHKLGIEIVRGLFRRGINWRVHNPLYINFSHTDSDIEEMLKAFKEAVVEAKKTVFSEDSNGN